MSEQYFFEAQKRFFLDIIQEEPSKIWVVADLEGPKYKLANKKKGKFETESKLIQNYIL